MCAMSESAECQVSFLIQPLRQIIRPDTLPTAGAEDKPMLGSKLSADSGPDQAGVRSASPSKLRTGMA